MALRLGIGDAFTICKGAVDFCSAVPRVHDEEVQSAVAEMIQMKAHLKALESRIGDETSFSKARPELAPVIKRSLEPLQRDLLEARSILSHECTRKESVHVLEQVRYLVLYKSKLEAFRNNLPEHRASIALIHDLMEDSSPTKRRDSVLMLEDIAERQKIEQQKQDKLHISQVELFQEFANLHSAEQESQHLAAQEMLDQLESHFIRRGSSQEDTELQLLPAKRALLLNSTTSRPIPATTRMPSFKLNMFSPIFPSLPETVDERSDLQESAAGVCERGLLDRAVVSSSNLSSSVDE